jgi:hypothetical protein
MAKFLQLDLREANGPSQRTEELETFISIHNMDVVLVSETHFTEKSHQLPNYTNFHTNHPAGTARGGTAIIIKYSSNIIN